MLCDLLLGIFHRSTSKRYIRRNTSSNSPISLRTPRLSSSQLRSNAWISLYRDTLSKFWSQHSSFQSMQWVEVHALGPDTAETCCKHLEMVRKGQEMLGILLTLDSETPRLRRCSKDLQELWRLSRDTVNFGCRASYPLALCQRQIRLFEQSFEKYRSSDGAEETRGSERTSLRSGRSSASLQSARAPLCGSAVHAACIIPCAGTKWCTRFLTFMKERNNEKLMGWITNRDP